MSKVMMGVTTEITGEGESIAPVNERLIMEQEEFNRRYNLTVDWGLSLITSNDSKNRASESILALSSEQLRSVNT